MLNENIKSFRKAKGLSQEELAVKVNVVRQTISQKLEVINLQLAKQKESRRKPTSYTYDYFDCLCRTTSDKFQSVIGRHTHRWYVY